jgi:CRISPR-associated protein Cmr1
LLKQLELNSETKWHSYPCKLVTPMYGGGVKAGEVDKEMPIRATEIRGQLRFWWRIACGPFASSQEMFRRETAIWGGIGSDTPTASKVQVRVTCTPVTPAQLVSSASETNPAIKYAFGSAAINGAVEWLSSVYEFKLDISRPDECAEEVDRALRWWASFGGVGARTRRGFGAVHLDGVNPVLIVEVDKLGGRLKLTGSGNTKAEIEWKTAVDRLFSFRQKGGMGRKDGKPRPGRSYWPEPDQIRRFTRRDANGKHAPVHEAGNVFPRAAFGLPITFEFKGSPGDPSTTELQPEEGDRMASPLILRPYWNGRMWQAAALLIPGWEKALTQKLKFKGQTYRPAHWPEDRTERQKLAKQIKPMQQAGGNIRADDPLSAFMEFFEKGQ